MKVESGFALMASELDELRHAQLSAEASEIVERVALGHALEKVRASRCPSQ